MAEKDRHHVKDVYDVVVDILSRLPVKSLLRFRSVCKSWRALILDSYFVKKYLKHAQTSNNSVKLLYLPNITTRTVSIQGLFEPHDRTQHQYSDDIFGNCVVINCCNGLVCLRARGHYPYDANIYSEIFIWNPSTRVIKKLPKHDLAPTDSHFYGFGYDANADDYKLIMGAAEKTQFGIFSLRTGLWRFVDEDFNFGGIENGRCYFVNGALHWQKLGCDKSKRIVSYDLANAKWEQLCSLSDESVSNIIIGTTGNRLCYWLYNRDMYEPKEIWVMNEYGKDKPWTKHINIPTQVDGHLIFPTQEHISENDEALMTLDWNEYVVYSSRENKYRTIPQPPTTSLWCTQVAVCLDTLVSPQFGI